MAFVAQDDKQNVNGQQPGQGAQGGASTGGGVSFAGSGGFSTNPVSTAGVGAGGAGGWTNIQSYLNANQGSTSSGDALKNTVGGTFDSEQKNLDQSSSDAKSKADNEVQKTNIGQDQASQMVQEMGSNYNYGGQQNQTYNQDLNRFQTGLNGTYQGPTSYNYALGADAQRYGQALGSDQGFQGLMGDVYNKAAGGLMGQGQLSLQQNLDQDNPYLAQARQALTSQYAGLQGNVQSTVADTDAAVKAAQQQYAKNQQGIRDYLTGTQTTDQGQMQQAIDAWNAAEQAIASGQNKVYLGSGPQGNESRNYYKAASDRTGTPRTFQSTQTLNDSDYYNYAPGGTADMTNVAGEDSQRGQLNSIADILGGAKINQGGPISHGGYNFDQGRYNSAWDNANTAAQSDLNRQIQLWLTQQQVLAPPTTTGPKPSPFNPTAPF